MSTTNDLEDVLLEERERVQAEIEDLEKRLMHIDGLLDGISRHLYVYEVESESDPTKIYNVTEQTRDVTKPRYTCDCPDYVFRSKKDQDHRCKHITEIIRDSIRPDVRAAVNRWGT